MTLELARLLITSGAIPRSQLQAALFESVCHRLALSQVLVAQHGFDPKLLDSEQLVGAAPLAQSVVPLFELVVRLPTGLCRTLLAVPVHADPATAMVDVATNDPLDSHIQSEFSYHLKTPVRLVRASVSSLEQALRYLEGPCSSGLDAGRTTLPFEPREDQPVLELKACTTQRPHPSDIPIPLIRKSATQQAAPSQDQTSEPADMARNAVLAPTRARSAHSPSTFSARAPKAPHEELDQCLNELRLATTREEIARLILRAMRTVTPRAGILILRKNAFSGWMCTTELTVDRKFRLIHIPEGQPSAIHTASSKGSFLGHIPDCPPHGTLLEALQTSAAEVLLVAVRVGDRTVMLILGTDLADTETATHFTNQLAHEGGEALTRILSIEKRLR